MSIERRSIVILGSGPAGTATSLYLQKTQPALAAEALLIDKAAHPREKVCAGGLVPHALDCLEELDVPLDVPHATVDAAAVTVPSGKTISYRDRNLCRVVRRNEFDASLANVCRQRGIELRERERVLDLRREGDEIRVETDRHSYLARVVVGADGSGSIVRRRLLDVGVEHLGRAVMCDVEAPRWDGHAAGRYEFNFSCVPKGIRGYGWAFPCVIDGRPHVNVGVYSLDLVGRVLYDRLEDEVTRLGAQVTRAKAFPIRWYHPSAPLAAPGVLLVGDAAGVDPLMGEGISAALEYGKRAANALQRAFVTGRYDFAEYDREVHSSWFGCKLRRLGMATRLFYGPTWPFWFAVAARSGRLQEIGIRWYNGVGGWDRAPRRAKLRALWRGELVVT